MVIVVKSGDTKKNIKNVLANANKKSSVKGVSVYKFVGKINLTKDALTIQKELRNEW